MAPVTQTNRELSPRTTLPALDRDHSVFKNATVNAAEHLGWAPGTLLINFQLDGASAGSGSLTAFIHRLTIFRW